MMVYPPRAPWVIPAPPTPVTSEEGPAPRAPRGLAPTRYALVVAIVVVAITVAAMVLAVIGPALASSASSPIPSGWAKIYDASLSDDGNWLTPVGCSFTASGLDAQAPSTPAAPGCTFGPSQNGDLTSQGVLVQVALAPAASVRGNQVPQIALNFEGAPVTFSINQEGQFELCLPDGSLTCPSDATVAWHEDGFVANTMALRYVNGIVTGYANDQQIIERSVNVLGLGRATISLAATRGNEALFTHATIYSGNGS